VTDSITLTYHELAGRVDQQAAALRNVGRDGDRVAIVGDNSADYVVALYGVPRAQRVQTLLNQRLHVDEQARLVDRVGAVAVIGDGDRVDRLRGADPGAAERLWLPFGRPSAGPLPDPDGWTIDAGPGDGGPAWLIHTSGTTGPAKAVPLTGSNLRAAIAAGARGRPVIDGDVYLFPFPLCHVAAYNVLLQHQYGATVIVSDGFDAGETLATVARHRVTTMSLAPTMIVRLLEHPAIAGTDLSSLRSIGYGAAALPPDVRRRAEEVLGCVLVEGYGMTELAGNAAFDGVPDESISLRLVDGRGTEVPDGEAGEIVARGAQVASGYWRDPAATADAFVDGWFRTGDIARFDDRSRLVIVDRRKDIVITGGENVASREVEDVLVTHPGVAEVAVVGLPDPEWGERIVAVIVPASGATPDDLPDSVVRHCREHLAGFKTPRQVEVLDALPVNSTGKIDKVALRRHLVD